MHCQGGHEPESVVLALKDVRSLSPGGSKKPLLCWELRTWYGPDLPCLSGCWPNPGLRTRTTRHRAFHKPTSTLIQLCQDIWLGGAPFCFFSTLVEDASRSPGSTLTASWLAFRLHHVGSSAPGVGIPHTKLWRMPLWTMSLTWPSAPQPWRFGKIGTLLPDV